MSEGRRCYYVSGYATVQIVAHVDAASREKALAYARSNRSALNWELSYPDSPLMEDIEIDDAGPA